MISLILFHLFTWAYFSKSYYKIPKIDMLGQKKVSEISLKFLVFSLVFEFFVYIIFIPILKDEIDWQIMGRTIIICKLMIHDFILKKYKINMEINIFFQNIEFWFTFFIYHVLLDFSSKFIIEQEGNPKIFFYIIYFSETLIISNILLLFSNSEKLTKKDNSDSNIFLKHLKNTDKLKRRNSE